MARALESILTELNSVYDPQRKAQTELYNQNLSAVDPMQQADLAGLEAAKKDSFGQIEQGANRRGMFYSGIPIQEQAKYVGQSYLPAVANLQGKYAQIRGNLKDSLANILANINTEQRKFGQDIYGREVSQDIERERIAAQERADAANRASAASMFNPTGGGGGGGGGVVAGAVAAPYFTNTNGSYAFRDANKRPITAAQYAQQTGQDIRDVLADMGDGGDATARQVYNNILKDPFFNTPQGQARYAQMYPQIFGGGAPAAARPAAPKPAPAPVVQSAQRAVTPNTYTGKLSF